MEAAEYLSSAAHLAGGDLSLLCPARAVGEEGEGGAGTTEASSEAVGACCGGWCSGW